MTSGGFSASAGQGEQIAKSNSIRTTHVPIRLVRAKDMMLGFPYRFFRTPNAAARRTFLLLASVVPTA